MSDSPIESMIFLLQETLKTYRASGRIPQRQTGFLEDFRGARLVPIFQRYIRASQHPFHLCLVGLTNVGKSTLIEALLGVPVAPKKNGPATAVPVEYSHADAWTLEVHYYNARHLPLTRTFPDANALARAIAQHVLDLDDAHADSIATVSVKGPFPLLSSNLILADTPGFGAATTDEAAAPAAPTIPPFLENAGSCYLCVSAGVGWEVSPEEHAFYSSISTLCTNVLVTKWEGSEDDQTEWMASFGKLFQGAEFEFVNARRAFNVERVKNILEDLSSKDRRLALVRGEVLRAWQDLERHFKVVFKSGIPWQPAALARFQSSCQHYPELSSLLTVA